MSSSTKHFQLHRGSFILYWMQQAQRVQDNPALEYAIDLANTSSLPLVVLFVLTDRYPEANQRHYTFMLQGMQDTWLQLTKLNITCLIMSGEMVDSVVAVASYAAQIVMDKGYLLLQRQWRADIAAKVHIPVIQVESEPFIPVETVMQSEAYGALSIRTRMYRLLQDHTLRLAGALPVNNFCPEILKQALLTHLKSGNATESIQPQFYTTGSQIPDIGNLRIDKSVSPVTQYIGGYQEAKKRLTYFQDNLLSKFQASRGDPATQMQSDLSPYLHFGQISIRSVISALLESEGLSDKEFFKLVRQCKPGNHGSNKVNGLLEMFEEGVVRRELSFNFCHFNPDYSSYQCLPRWAMVTLTEHKQDKRMYSYGLDIFEQAETHDEYWNAAQKEMLLTGKMHGYMRMYWGKKILEWCECPEDAYKIALYLNNKYELDGRDANGFAGIAWCFGKHDRPWTAHAVYGNVRSMTESGLLRKFDMKTYLERIKQL